MSIASALMQYAANNEEAMYFSNPPGTMSVNSQASYVALLTCCSLPADTLILVLSLDWRSAHFGCPKSVCFHTSGTSVRYLRAFRANPERQVNGSRSLDDSDGALDISFGVPRAIEAQVQESIKTEMQVCIMELVQFQGDANVIFCSDSTGGKRSCVTARNAWGCLVFGSSGGIYSIDTVTCVDPCIVAVIAWYPSSSLCEHLLQLHILRLEALNLHLRRVHLVE